MSVDFYGEELCFTREAFQRHIERMASWEAEWGAVGVEKVEVRRALQFLWSDNDDYNEVDDGCGYCGVCDVCTFDPLEFYELRDGKIDTVFRARTEDRHHARRARHRNRGARAAHLRRREVSRRKYYRSMTYPEICHRTVRMEHTV